MSWEPDLEIEELFEDGGLLETATLLRSPATAAPAPDPTFQARLRRQLMEEAATVLQPPKPWWRRVRDGLSDLPSRVPDPRQAWAMASEILTPPRLAALGATVGVALVALVVVIVSSSPGHVGTTVVRYQSPLDHAQSVALVEPIDINFNQPMDHSSVEQAVQIMPATQVRYQWQGDTLQITPVNGLAPNTQYQVTVAGTARTATGRALSQTQPVVFTTTTPPSPTPTPTPTGSLPLVGGLHELAPAGDSPARWSLDGSTLYVIDPQGRLSSVPSAGGPGTVIATGGVTLVVVGPNGLAYTQNGDVHNGDQTLRNVAPVAMGFRSGKLLLVRGSTVEQAGSDHVATLSEQPKAADFSPAGDRLAYIGQSGLHLVDLGSGNDATVGPANALGGWSGDGRHYAYTRDGGLYVTDGGQPSRLADAPGVTAVTWSSGGQLLLTGSNGLLVLYSDGSRAGAAVGGFDQPQWAPGGGGLFAFKRDGALWIGQIGPGGVGTPGPSVTVSPSLAPATTPTPTASSGLVVCPSTSATASGGRSYVLIAQAGRMVVRTVTGPPGNQVAVDQILTVARDAAGDCSVQSVTSLPAQALGSGPDVLGVQVTSSQVTVMFDADLNPQTVSGGVSIKGLSTTGTYNSHSRTVTLTPSKSLTAGTSYDLVVSQSLQDVAGHPATIYDLSFTGPS
jgi:hypothetical protein